MDDAAAALRTAVLAALRSPADAQADDEAFDRLARRIFEHQFAHNRPYAAYCERRGRTPDRVSNWTLIPPVPAAAFREVPLFTARPENAAIVFRTSGTTGGDERRGAHYLLDTSLYEASLLASFTAHVLPDGKRPRMVGLIPPRAQMPDSSLAYMVGTVMRELAPDSTHVVDRERGIDVEAVERLLAESAATGEAVCLLGTSFSFVHLLDALAASGRTYVLPPGSRIMDTGGYKGRSREVPADELRAAYGSHLGVLDAYCINEYGMTELCSQYYDATLLDAVRSDSQRPRRKTGPPWLRARILDPETLEPVTPGDVGIIQHVDLANVDSVVAVLTEDLGREVEDGFVVLGRARGATPRGCSIALDDLLRATRARNR